ncbi:hypothetical protein QM600_18410 [Rhodococcus sp. IEGM 1379]|nr:hypothetical protein [Rhodococcus sp. IEGM 1379]
MIAEQLAVEGRYVNKIANPVSARLLTGVGRVRGVMALGMRRAAEEAFTDTTSLRGALYDRRKATFEDIEREASENATTLPDKKLDQDHVGGTRRLCRHSGGAGVSVTETCRINRLGGVSCRGVHVREGGEDVKRCFPGWESWALIVEAESALLSTALCTEVAKSPKLVDMSEFRAWI